MAEDLFNAHVLIHRRLYPPSLTTRSRQKPNIVGMDRPSVIGSYCTAYHWDGLRFIKASLGPTATIHTGLLDFGGGLPVRSRMVVRGCQLFRFRRENGQSSPVVETLRSFLNTVPDVCVVE